MESVNCNLHFITVRD